LILDPSELSGTALLSYSFTLAAVVWTAVALVRLAIWLAAVAVGAEGDQASGLAGC
jgi:hypothetical protein